MHLRKTILILQFSSVQSCLEIDGASINFVFSLGMFSSRNITYYLPLLKNTACFYLGSFAKKYLKTMDEEKLALYDR